MATNARLAFAVTPGEAGARLGPFLRRQGISLSLLRSQKRVPGGILLNGLPAHTDRVLAPGDTVALALPEATAFSAQPEDIPLEIVYESAAALVVNKAPGMTTHPTGRTQSGTLANAFCGLVRRRGGVGVFRPVGRLDAGTSGLALCAMHAAAAPMLAKSAGKVYLALAEGALPPGEGCIEAPLGPAPGSAVLQRVHEGGRPSRTFYTVAASSAQGSLAWVRPATGRTHQIRAHFAHIGHPLVGDALYGGGTALMARQALHCARLSFTEPDGSEQSLYRPPPRDMLQALAALGLALDEER